MKKLASFLYSILGGASVAIGAAGYLAVENPAVGTLIFSLGLFAVCVNGFHLFPGKAAYVLDNGPSYLPFLGAVWVGNLIGAFAVGAAIRASRLQNIVARSQTVWATKSQDSLLSIFLLSILCGIVIIIAVDSYRNNPHQAGKYLGIVVGVMLYTLCGLDNSSANMFYAAVSGAWTLRSLVCLIVATLGNWVGCLTLPLCRKLKQSVEP